MPLRSRAFSDLHFSPPERHPGTIRGNKDRHSRSANECICVAGSRVGHKRTHHVPPDLRSAPAAPAPPPGEGRHPSSVEEARQWTIGRRYASVFPLSILLYTNRFLPTPPRQQSSMAWSPPLQGNSAAIQRDWMVVSRPNLNGTAGNVSAETSLGCRQSPGEGTVGIIPPSRRRPPLVGSHYSVSTLVLVVGAIPPPPPSLPRLSSQWSPSSSLFDGSS
jgi:hypothetical protein